MQLYEPQVVIQLSVTCPTPAYLDRADHTTWSQGCVLHDRLGQAIVVDNGVRSLPLELLKPAHRIPGCSAGLNPPLSRSDLAM